MNQFDVSLEYAIFSKAQKEALDQLKADLAKRSYSVKMIFERDGLTKELLERANREETYIKNIISYISTSESLINILITNLVNKHELQIDWREEYLRECKSNLEFVEMMIGKYNKLKNDGKAA